MNCLCGDLAQTSASSPSAANALRLSKGWRCLGRERCGSAAVEFAILAPVFLIFLLGILLYGIYLGAVHAVSQLAADAARVSIAGINDDERRTLAEKHVKTHAGNFPLLKQGKVSVIAGPLSNDPAQFSVSVRFDASDLPVWIAPELFVRPDKIIVRTSTIRRGGY